MKINNESLIINKVSRRISRVYEEMAGEKNTRLQLSQGTLFAGPSQKGFVQVFNVYQKLIRPFPSSKKP